MVSFIVGLRVSILGPLLFILYVNDLPNVSSKLSFTQFADDTSIFITGKNLKDMSNLMTDQMKRVSDWLKINMLTVNVFYITHLFPHHFV